MTPDRIGQRIDNYQLSQKLGGGSFGQVYLAEDLRRKTKVAIKVLDPFMTPKERDQFFDEVRSLVRLHHPHIVSVIDFGIDKRTNLPFIVMEYASNGSLRQKHHGQQLPLATVVHYVKQIASALQYAHDDQLIHRDVKPDNIFIGTNSELLLGDFGIAVLSSTGLVSLQQPQGSGGTPVYMAPEQITGTPSRSSDQYALAIITYEWLCGKPPFTGSMIEIMGQHLNAAPRPIREIVPTIPLQVEQVVLKALAKEVKDRFPTIQAFEDALEAVSRIVPIGTRLLTYTGHISTVSAVAWSPDGSRIVSSSWDNTVQVWSAASGQRLFTRTGPYQVSAVAWSPDGSRIASNSYPFPGNGEKTIHIWNASSGQQLLIYTGHTDTITAVAWSPDGSRIASSSWDRTVQVWDTTSGHLQIACTGHTKLVQTVAWSPDGSHIASTSNDGTVQVWDAMSGHLQITCYTGHAMMAVAWSPDGSRIASASSDRTVQVWDAMSGHLVKAYAEHNGTVVAVAWSPDGSRIASTSGEWTIQIWDAGSEKCLFTYRGHAASVYAAVAWSPDGSRIASGSTDNTVQVWQAV